MTDAFDRLECWAFLPLSDLSFDVSVRTRGLAGVRGSAGERGWGVGSDGSTQSSSPSSASSAKNSLSFSCASELRTLSNVEREWGPGVMGPSGSSSVSTSEGRLFASPLPLSASASGETEPGRARPSLASKKSPSSSGMSMSISGSDIDSRPMLSSESEGHEGGSSCTENIALCVRESCALSQLENANAKN